MTVTASLTSCTEVELCTQDEHPHRATVEYLFDWGSYDYRPDSMVVLATRVINMWKGAMMVSSKTGMGYYAFNRSVEGSEPESLEEPEIKADSSTVSGQTKPQKSFQIPGGDYKFVAFNRNVSELNYDKMTAYYTDPAMPLHGITVGYNVMRRDSAGLERILYDWIDWNPYAGYIQPSSEAIFYDTIAVRTLRANQTAKLTFKPKPLTQHIRVIFDIEKVKSAVPFTIDSVFAEMSGIPFEVDLSTGYIDIRKTAKMMYKTNLYDANGRLMEHDNETNYKIVCQKDINVPGIVRSENNQVFRGPGIMQVYIIASTKEPRRRKKFQGVINLYATLTQADLIHYTEDRQYAVPWGKDHVIHVKLQTPLRLDGNNIIEDPDDGSGLDVWKEVEPGEEIVVDI